MFVLEVGFLDDGPFWSHREEHKLCRLSPKSRETNMGALARNFPKPCSDNPFEKMVELCHSCRVFVLEDRFVQVEVLGIGNCMQYGRDSSLIVFLQKPGIFRDFLSLVSC